MPKYARKRVYKKKTAKVSKTVKRYVNKKLASTIEDKFADTEFITSVVDYNGLISNLQDPTPGTGSGNRIGDTIRPVKLMIRGSFQGTNIHIGRFIVFRWLPSSVPVVSSVLDATFLGNFNAVNAPYEEDNVHMFRILYDKTMLVGGDKQVSCTTTIPRKRLGPINYSGTSTTATGKLYAILIQDGTVTLNSFYITLRMAYEDA